MGLTQGGSLYDITVGTVVDVDVHGMVLFYLDTAAERPETQLEWSQLRPRGSTYSTFFSVFNS